MHGHVLELTYRIDREEREEDLRFAYFKSGLLGMPMISMKEIIIDVSSLSKSDIFIITNSVDCIRVIDLLRDIKLINKQTFNLRTKLEQHYSYDNLKKEFNKLLN